MRERKNEKLSIVHQSLSQSLTVQDHHSGPPQPGRSVAGGLQSKETPPVLHTLHLQGLPGRLVRLVAQLGADGSLLDPSLGSIEWICSTGAEHRPSLEHRILLRVVPGVQSTGIDGLLEDVLVSLPGDQADPLLARPGVEVSPLVWTLGLLNVRPEGESHRWSG